MGSAIPQVITPSRATGAQVIDGSLSFNNENKPFLKRDFATGSRTTWTWSAWVRFGSSTLHTFAPLFNNRDPYDSNTNFLHLSYNTSTNKISCGMYDASLLTSDRVFRDFKNFYHIVFVMDSGNSKFELYVNGELDKSVSASGNYGINSNVEHLIARYGRYHSGAGSEDYYWDGSMSQVYLIDGQALGPENFGFTDPLTNTWKPKKYTGDFNIAADSYSTDIAVFTINNTTPNADSTVAYLNSNPDSSAYPLIQSSQSSNNTVTVKFASAQNGVTGIKFRGGGYAAGSTYTLFVNGTQVGGTHSTNSLWSEDSHTISSTNITELKIVGSDGFALGQLKFDDTLVSGTVSFGTEATGVNSFYLPMDGNSPIGQDQSGQGNDWTPENFGGSVALDSPAASGARPILNTTQGGAQAAAGAFGSKENKTVTVTVGSKTGGGNAYFFDSVERDSLATIRGSTITFDTTDSTNNTHPFKLSSTNADSSGGTEYTDGVAYYINGSVTTGADYVTNYAAGAGSGFRGIKWTVPHNVSTTYYYCTVHNGMGEDGRLTSTTDETKADPYAWKNFLALPLVGNDDDVSDYVNCTSNAKTATNSSVTASTAQSNFYGGSHYWSANSDTLQYAESGNELVFGTGDFTIEFWYFDDGGHSGTGGRTYLFDNRIGGSEVGDPPTLAGWLDGTEVNLYITSGGGTISYVGSFENKWYHYAAVRSGTTVTLYLDGVARGTMTSSTNFTNNGIGVGRATDANYGFAGYMQDFRVYNGVAKYTSDFVPVATSPDVLPDTPSGVAGGSKLTKITDGAVSFDGTNDTLSVPDHADFTFGSGDFTLEAFVYNRSSGYRSLVMKYGGSPSTSSWFWSMYNGQNSFYYYSGSNEPSVTSGKTHYNKWVHCAVSREGNTIRIFDNGELTGTLDVSSYDTMNDSTVPLDIGTDYADNYDMDGFISNVRIVKGTALYTKSFTAPSAPLTNVTNTKLLCCQSNASAGAAAVSPQISGLNSGIVWSDYLTTTQGADPRDFYTGNNYPPSNLFDGDTSTIVYGGWTDDDDDNSDLIFSPPSGISVSSKLEVYVGYYDKIKVNGTTYNTGGESTAQDWVIVSDGSNFTGTLTELILENTTNANVVRAAAIRIDDSTILLDPVLQQGNAVATNFNPFNTDIHTVRGQETGQVTLNPLSTGEATLTKGNLEYSSSSNMHTVTSTISVSSGKWYWENQRVSGGSHYYVGIADVDTNVYGNWTGSNSGYSWSVNTSGSICHNNAEGGALGSVSSIAGSDKVIGWALDMDEGTLVIYANGKPVIPSSITSPHPKNRNSIVSTNDLAGRRISPAHGHSSHRNMRYNFGQKPFKYAPPDGFQPLNAANLRPETVISRPDQYVGIITHTQNPGAVKRYQTPGRFAPDLVWSKERGGSSAHNVFDTVRGATKRLTVNTSNDEDTQSNMVQAFHNDGFTYGIEYPNNSGQTGVYWCWKAGGNKNTFNIDDVGYASASDVGMNVGGQNSNAYDTSAIWSGMMSGTSNSGVYTSLFDGTDGPSAGYEQPSDGNTLTFTPTGGITASRSIEIYVHQSADTYAGSADITVNGTSIKTGNVQSALGTGSESGYVNIGTKSLTKLTWSNPSGSNNDYRLMAIRVDGKILVDSNQTPPNVPSIAATGCSVGTKQGFSIVKYVGNDTLGATLAHGLTQEPDVFITKADYDNREWQMYHKSLGGTQPIRLNTTDAAQSAHASYFNDTTPSSSVVTFGNGGDANQGGETPLTYIMYAWHDVPGLQKFGSYVGNEDTGGDGPFVELGFRPAIIWIKNSEQGSSAADWVIYDSERNKFNPSGKQLYPNRDIAEADDSNHQFDILSNGFKVRSTSTSDLTNATDKYIYCAWAASPSVDLFGGGANAR